ncbi:MAG: transglycosylase SLT domain-containing protein [Cellvibrionaceae bacterium]
MKLKSPSAIVRTIVRTFLGIKASIAISAYVATVLFSPTSIASDVDFHSPQLSAQRQYYIEARDALKAGRQDRYQILRQRLSDYPLLPYLDYQAISRQLNSYPYQQVDGFLDKHKDTYLGQLLLRQWLNQLAKKQWWHEYRSYYTPSLKSATHRCLHLWSRYKTGDKKALADVVHLWNVSKSQPDQCDALFKQWQQAGYLTTDLMWERYRKALLANNRKLSAYLKRRLPNDIKALANTFQQVLNNPESLNNKSHHKQSHPYYGDIVFYGLNRYARFTPDGAWQLWQDYTQFYHFTEKQQSAFYYSVAKRYAYNAKHTDTKRLLGGLSKDRRTTVIEISIRELLKEQKWPEISQWIGFLPSEDQQSDRWLYWKARAKQALSEPEESYKPTYETLAKTRSFYGFLSADYINQTYSLQNSPTNIQQQTLESLKATPAFARARELFFIDKLHDARQEWAFATSGLSEEEHQGAAILAYEWGWYRKSIESMAAAKAWDDLSLRFPIAHEKIIEQQAQQTSLPSTLIYAIARQESAWESDARSRAGAMGLMQILPRTAKETASKAGITHTKKDLLRPKHNIALGSRYIGELLHKFNNNRVPAIAAYNAGPSRVNRWLAETGSQLPHDIWIEVIPFGETRKYVQNVLSYAVVYAYRMGEKAPLLTKSESNRLL